MMFRSARAAVIWVVVTCCGLLAYAAVARPAARASDGLFGQNRPHAAAADWRALETPRFRILFPDASSALAAETLRLAEAAAKDIGARFGAPLTKRSTWVVFPSRDAMAKSNVPLDDLEEGLRAWTPLVRRRQLIVFNGSRTELARDVAHGVTHALQTQVLFPSGGWAVVGRGPLFHAADWFLEGTAQHFSGAPGAGEDIDLRGASLANSLLSLEELQDFNEVPDLGLAYMQAQSIVGYIADEFGEPSLGRLLQAVASHPRNDIDDALTDVVGIDLRTLNRRWQRYAKKRYWPLIREKESPDAVARTLRIPVAGHAGDPVWSASGEALAVLTQTYDHDEVWVVSARTGALLSNATRRVRDRYDAIVSRGRALAWATGPDELAFVARRGAGLRLIAVDVITGGLAYEVDLPFHDAFSLTASRDGETLVMVGVTDGQADLYAYGPTTGEWRRVTNDLYLDADPMLNADGTELLYISERGGETQVVRSALDGTDGEQTPLGGAGGIHDPQWSPDGADLYVTADWTGSRDVYRVAGADARITRLTNLISGANTPVLSPDGESLAFSAAQGGQETVFVLSMSSAERELTQPPPAGGPVVSPVMASGGEESRAAPAALLLDDVQFALYTPADGVPRAAVEATATSWTGNARVRLGIVTTPREAPRVSVDGTWLRGRVDGSVGVTTGSVFHRTPGDDDLLGQREHGARAALAYPLSVRRRLVLSASATNAPLRYRFEGVSASSDSTTTATTSVALVHDSVAMSSRLGPVSGSRYRLEAGWTTGGSGVEAVSLDADVRKYARLASRTVLAMRVAASRSDGATPRRSYLGGHTSLRASSFEEFSGSRAALASVELRVPLLTEVRLAWPVRAGMRGIRGVLFMETGIAWNEGDKPRIARRTDDGLRLEDLTYEYGFGARARFLGARLRWDLARGHDFVSATAWRSVFRVDHDF
jgi:hypothetical protein